MNEIERKALTLLNECGWGGAHLKRTWNPRYEALCRAIEQHEAFKREVSDAVEAVFAGYYDAPIPWVVMRRKLEPFIIPKTDPLVEVMQDWWDTDGYANIETFRAAIEARGGRIVWEGE